MEVLSNNIGIICVEDYFSYFFEDFSFDFFYTTRAGGTLAFKTFSTRHARGKFLTKTIFYSVGILWNLTKNFLDKFCPILTSAGVINFRISSLALIAGL